MDQQTLPVDDAIRSIDRMENIMMEYGQELIMSLIVLIVGLLIVRWVMKPIRRGLNRIIPSTTTASTIANIIGVFLLTAVLISAASEAGFEVVPIFRLIMAVLLIVVGVIIFFRPYIPTLPFEVGQTIKAAGLMGKVEAISFVNTRIRTFDGKVFFVPNKTILNDIVINYHFTPTRRMKIDIPIRYDQDIIKAKRLLEAVMIEDPRVKKSPRPVVWVMDVSNGCVKLGGRCWADNIKYWATRVDLIEKAKIRFDNEGIAISYPHLGVHHFDTSGEHIDMDEKFAGHVEAPSPAV